MQHLAGGLCALAELEGAELGKTVVGFTWCVLVQLGACWCEHNFFLYISDSIYFLFP